MRSFLRWAALLALFAVPTLGCDPPPAGRPDAGRTDAYDGPGDLDGDTISDEHEGGSEGRDTDDDGTLDSQDPDSDGDGISDADEAGDADEDDEDEAFVCDDAE